MKERAPDTDQNYVRAVLTMYLGLPETPLRASSQDQLHAHQLQQRGVPLTVIESAFLLASLRRLVRPADSPSLSPIRPLAYFQPVIEELLCNPVPEGYLEYLRHKLEHFLVKDRRRKPGSGGCPEKYGST
jgi:hypothetical protein